MKCIVDRIAEKSLSLIEGPTKPSPLNEVQQKVQAVFLKFDFGCQNEAVASIMEALTGHKPVRLGITRHVLFEAVTSNTGVRGLILGISGGSLYVLSVDHAVSHGYFALSDAVLVPASVATRKKIITAFQKFHDHDVMEFLMTKLAGNYPTQALKALD